MTDAVRDYLNGIGRTPLLTGEQERALGARIEAGALARRRLAEETGLDGAGLRALEAAAADGERARDHMVRANVRLVVSIARRYAAGGGLPLLDLIQEGNIGMMRAVDKFDHRRGLKFSTYATWWIKQSIGRALADQSRTVRLPVHVVELLNRVTRTRRALGADLGREPTAEEIADALDLPAAKVERVLRDAREPVSLHAPAAADGDGELGDLLPDGSPDPSDTVASSMLRGYLDSVLTALPEREAAVLTLRFGLDDDRPRTLDEIGRDYGLTRERIRQIEKKGMANLRRHARARDLAELLG
ncbi:sigma-70 family RNA polymerase sigma factor [Actinomadura algeriensis]|uniref:RNA polymerase primary sigma factor n=1 Tax=Actinomadura algeriensis TaxID=1679523 RepID=A0ABR9JRA0_9ACTN|nr:sigma-70 family RNA polymerase sigma factor [Actinomadura algeriensis]MBE1532650.1 RNA polymerase primary sigma factor [Actinomadura algeriensis]